MKKTFTKQYMRDNCGCYEDTKGKLDACSFMKLDGDISIYDILNSEIPLKDKAWFVVKKCELTERQHQELAIQCAELVLPIFDAKYPNNDAPRKAIQAATDYLEGNISRGYLLSAAHASYASYAAYAAAYAADAASHAAYAASYAAAYAADAADAAADAAYAAADAAALEELLTDFVNSQP